MQDVTTTVAILAFLVCCFVFIVHVLSNVSWTAELLIRRQFKRAYRTLLYILVVVLWLGGALAACLVATNYTRNWSWGILAGIAYGVLLPFVAARIRPAGKVRILVYEYVTACGDASLPDSLRVEGVAMYSAVTGDLAACSDVEVVPCRGDFEELVIHSGCVLLIAPESAGILTSLAESVEDLIAPRLISPSSDFCRWAGDKSQVAETMQAAGVPMPRGILLKPNESVSADFPRPAMLKPNDGCGSQSITLLRPGESGRRPDEGTLREAGDCVEATTREVVHPAYDQLPSPDRCRDRPLPVGEAERYRVEEYVPGLAVSVALLRGPAGVFALPACEQRLSDDGKFTYLGGRCPIQSALAARAKKLALRAAAAMPEWRGYIGLDLVLGPASDGSQDYLIEVNPRLTTSYVGLRALSEINLAQAMLDIIAGRVPQLVFCDRGVEFDADGTVRYV